MLLSALKKLFTSEAKPPRPINTPTWVVKTTLSEQGDPAVTVAVIGASDHQIRSIIDIAALKHVPLDLTPLLQIDFMIMDIKTEDHILSLIEGFHELEDHPEHRDFMGFHEALPKINDAFKKLKTATPTDTPIWAVRTVPSAQGDAIAISTLRMTEDQARTINEISQHSGMSEYNISPLDGTYATTLLLTTQEQLSILKNSLLDTENDMGFSADTFQEVADKFANLSAAQTTASPATLGR